MICKANFFILVFLYVQVPKVQLSRQMDKEILHIDELPWASLTDKIFHQESFL